MARPWRLNGRSRFQECFEERLLARAASRHVYDVVEAAVLGLVHRPFSGTPIEEFPGMFALTTRAFEVPGNPAVRVPAMLIIYALEEPAHVIRPMYVCDAADATDGLGRVAERALLYAQRVQRH